MRAAIQSRYRSDTGSGRDGLLSTSDLENKKHLSARVVVGIILVFYLFIGYAYYGVTQKLDFITAMYFCVTTMMTIGYGDFHATTDIHSEVFTTFFVLLGGGIIGTIVGIYAGGIMDEVESVMKKKISKSVSLMNEVVKTAADKVKAIEHALDFKIGNNNHRDHIANDFGGTKIAVNEKKNIFQRMIKRVFDNNTMEHLSDMNVTLYDDELRQIRAAALLNFSVILILLFLGALIMMGIEGWHFTKAMYFTAVTLTTCGYGDIYPSDWRGRVFVIFLAIIGCSFAMKGFGEIIKYPMVVRAKQVEVQIAAQFGQQLSVKTLNAIVKNDFFERIPNLKRASTSITKAEFILLILQMMSKIDDKDVILACSIFDKLDTNREGCLSEEALLQEIENAKTHAATVDAAMKEEESGTITDLLANGGVAATRNILLFSGRIADNLVSASRKMTTFVEGIVSDQGVKHDDHHNRTSSIGDIEFNPIVDLNIIRSQQRVDAANLKTKSRSNSSAVNPLHTQNTGEESGTPKPPIPRKNSSPRSQRSNTVGSSNSKSCHSPVDPNAITQKNISGPLTPGSASMFWDTIIGTPVANYDPLPNASAERVPAEETVASSTYSEVPAYAPLDAVDMPDVDHFVNKVYDKIQSDEPLENNAQVMKDVEQLLILSRQETHSRQDSGSPFKSLRSPASTEMQRESSSDSSLGGLFGEVSESNPLHPPPDHGMHDIV